MTATPTAIWRIIEPPRARDGDSVYLVRERETYRDHDAIRIDRDARPVLCRLVWLKCPEISGPNADPIEGPRATKDAQYFFESRQASGFVAIQYGEEKYGRPLVDVRTTGGESLSVWMSTVMDWEVYR